MSVFEHSIEIPATPEAVFQAFQDPDILAQWWGPDGFTNTIAAFDFRAGGKWVYTMHGPDSRDYPNESEFIEIAPGSLIRLKHTALPHYDLTISLEPSQSGTVVSWQQVFENETFARKMRGFLETANKQNLQRLAALVTEIAKEQAGPNRTSRD